MAGHWPQAGVCLVPWSPQSLQAARRFPRTWLFPMPLIWPLRTPARGPPLPPSARSTQLTWGPRNLSALPLEAHPSFTSRHQPSCLDQPLAHMGPGVSQGGHCAPVSVLTADAQPQTPGLWVKSTMPSCYSWDPQMVPNRVPSSARTLLQGRAEEDSCPFQ